MEIKKKNKKKKYRFSWDNTICKKCSKPLIIVGFTVSTSNPNDYKYYINLGCHEFGCNPNTAFGYDIREQIEISRKEYIRLFLVEK